MSDTLDDVTDKEKEALRLVLAGHDAKSSARELDVSVHTLNDRLRSARRKLGVTSSKEAARILAQDEGDVSQMSSKPLVHKGLGVGKKDGIQEGVSAADRSEAGLFPLTARWKGILIMSFSIAIVAGVLVAVSPSTPSYSAASSETVSAPARPAQSELKARRFVGMIDAGLFDESYEEASQKFRDQTALGRYKFELTLRMTNGKIESRSLGSIRRTGEFNGERSGQFEIVEFNSRFASNNRQIERVVLERGARGWEVIDYEIVPFDTDKK